MIVRSIRRYIRYINDRTRLHHDGTMVVAGFTEPLEMAPTMRFYCLSRATDSHQGFSLALVRLELWVPKELAQSSCHRFQATVVGSPSRSTCRQPLGQSVSNTVIASISGVHHNNGCIVLRMPNGSTDRLIDSSQA